MRLTSRSGPPRRRLTVSSTLHPTVPAGAYDDFLPGALRDWTPADGPCPPSTSATAPRHCSTTAPGCAGS